MLPGEPYLAPSMEEFTADLARVNQYRTSDVAANRNGFMSTPQFFRLLWQASKPLRQATWAFCVWIALLTLVASIFRQRFMRIIFFQNYAIEAVTTSISVAIAFVAGVVHTTDRSWRLIKDLLAGEVTSVEGRLDPAWHEEIGEGLKRVRREMVRTYQYSVRQESFEVQPQAYEMLRSKYDDFRPVVRIYFTPRSRQVLSIEPMQVSAPTRDAASAMDPAPLPGVRESR
jgi:hypothetical protein